MKNSVNYISGLDGLRCFSILFVLLEHLGLENYLNRYLDVSIVNKISIVISGKTGVAVFFVISGYLITTILMEEKKTNFKIDFKNFFLRRFFRLFPAFFVFMMVLLSFFILTGRTNQNIFEAWGISFFYLYNFVPYGERRIAELGHTWSLAIEEQFYLGWPLIINFINQHLIKIILVVSFFAFILFKNFYDSLSISSVFESYRLTVPGAFPVILGCLVALFYQSNVLSGNNFILTLGFFLFLCSLWLPIGNQVILSQLNFFIQPIGVALILNSVVKNKNSGLVKFLEIPIFIWIGRLSYSIYLWQGLFLKNGPGSVFWIQQFPQNICLTVLCALLSFYLVEKKFIIIKNKYRVVVVNHD